MIKARTHMSCNTLKLTPIHPRIELHCVTVPHLCLCIKELYLLIFTLQYSSIVHCQTVDTSSVGTCCTLTNLCWAGPSRSWLFLLNNCDQFLLPACEHSHCFTFPELDSVHNLSFCYLSVDFFLIWLVG